jgi:hypothetical protein
MMHHLGTRGERRDHSGMKRKSPKVRGKMQGLRNYLGEQSSRTRHYLTLYNSPSGWSACDES